MALGPMAFFEKLPVKKITYTVGDVTIQNNGLYSIGSKAVTGYSIIGASIANVTTTSDAIGTMIYSNTIYITGKPSGTATNVKVLIVYLSTDYFDIQTS